MHKPVATIYLVTNSVNGKTYVGVTRRSLVTRWSSHIWVAMHRPKTYFHRAIAKYGRDNFTVEPIASCLDVESAVATERAIIQQLCPEYNQTNGGEFTVGKRASRETYDRISAANRGKRRTPEMKAANSAQAKVRWAFDSEYKQKALAGLARARGCIDRDKQRKASAIASRDRVWTDESRAKLSSSFKGRRPPQNTIDRARAKNKKAVICIETGIKFESVSEAAKAVGLDIGTISNVCRGTRPTAGGMHFEFERKS